MYKRQRVGFIGLGMRGPSAVERWTHIPGTKIVALCDLLTENAEKAQKIVTNAGMEAPALYSGSEDAWKQLCERNDIDLVYIADVYKRQAYERGYREGWRDRDDHRGKGRGHGHRH